MTGHVVTGSRGHGVTGGQMNTGSQGHGVHGVKVQIEDEISSLYTTHLYPFTKKNFVKTIKQSSNPTAAVQDELNVLHVKELGPLAIQCLSKRFN